MGAWEAYPAPRLGHPCFVDAQKQREGTFYNDFKNFQSPCVAKGTIDTRCDTKRGMWLSYLMPKEPFVALLTKIRSFGGLH